MEGNLVFVTYRFFDGHCLRIEIPLTSGGKKKTALYQMGNTDGPIKYGSIAVGLLEKLTESPGELIHRTTLAEAVGIGAGDIDNTLNTQLGYLRKLLGEKANAPKFIELIRGAGYRFRLPVETLKEDVGEKAWRDRGFAPALQVAKSPEIVPLQPDTRSPAFRDPRIQETTAPLVAVPEAYSPKVEESLDPSPPAQVIVDQGHRSSLFETKSTDATHLSPDVGSGQVASQSESNGSIPVQPSAEGGSPQISHSRSAPLHPAESAPWRKRRHQQWKSLVRGTLVWIAVGLLLMAFHPAKGTGFYYLVAGLRWVVWLYLGGSFSLIAISILVRAYLIRRLERQRAKLRVVITSFKDTELGQETRLAVVEAIREHLGQERVSIVTSETAISPHEIESDTYNVKTGAVLRSHEADLLIAGTLLDWGSGPRIKLRFISPNTAPSKLLNLGFIDYEVDAHFGPELGAAIAATAAAFGDLTISMKSETFKYRLRSIAFKLDPFVHSPPPTMKGSDQATLAAAYGFIQSEIGFRFCDPEVLELAVSAFQKAAEKLEESHDSLALARIQHSLGVVLGTLGAWGHGRDKLSRSQIAIEKAIAKWPRDTHRRNWAESQRYLGLTLIEIGVADGSPDRFEEAKGAFIAARDALSKKEEPLDWAQAISGYAWAMLYADENRGLPFDHFSPERICVLDEVQSLFELASVHIETALGDRSEYRYRAPLAWLDVSEGLCRTLYWRGSLDDDPERLKKAEKIAGAVANDYACTIVKAVRALHILGLIDCALAIKSGEKSRVHSALGYLDHAEVTGLKNRMPLEWARLQNTWCSTLATRASDRMDLALALKAIARLDELETLISPKHYPLLWVNIEWNRAITLGLLAHLDLSPTRVEEAILAWRNAIRLAVERDLDGDRLRSAIQLGQLFVDIGTRDGNMGLLEEARQLLQTVAGECPQVGVSRLRAQVNFSRALASFELGQQQRSAGLYNEAADAIRCALESLPPDAISDREAAEKLLGTILSKLSPPTSGPDL